MVDRRLRVAGVALGGLLFTWALWRAFPPLACETVGRVLARCHGSVRVYATLTSDLEALGTLEEAYVTEHWTYTYIPEDLGFIPTDGVTVSIAVSGDDGWAASATLPSLGEGQGCAIYMGDGSRYRPHLMDGHDVRPGRVFCTE